MMVARVQPLASAATTLRSCGAAHTTTQQCGAERPLDYKKTVPCPCGIQEKRFAPNARASCTGRRKETLLEQYKAQLVRSPLPSQPGRLHGMPCRASTGAKRSQAQAREVEAKCRTETQGLQKRVKLLQAENAELKRANDQLAHDKEERHLECDRLTRANNTLAHEKEQSHLECDRLAHERDTKEQHASSLELALTGSRGEVQAVRRNVAWLRKKQ